MRFLCLAVLCTLATAATVNYRYDVTTSSVNPQRGFVPFGGQSWDPCTTFPCSMENSYIAFIDIMKDWNTFNFSSIDRILSNVGGRAHQAILRVYVDYPDLAPSIDKVLPAFLVPGCPVIDNGDGTGVHPDYNNANLIRALTQLITALGKKYDGDNRIAVWQVGLLGHWGEWHNYPTEDFASIANQDLILRTFTSSFTRTKLMARYPNKVGSFVPSNLNIGYCDDSFLEDTYGSESWYFYNQLSSVQATDIWLTQPIGGEVYPPHQKCILTGATGCGTNWTISADKIHPSWMWNNYAFDPSYSGQQLVNARNAALQLGYQIYLQSTTVTKITTSYVAIDAVISNRGNAPFYHNMYLVLSCGGGTATATINTVPGTANRYRLYLSGSYTNGTMAQLSLKSDGVMDTQKIRFVNGEDSNGVIQVKLA